MLITWCKTSLLRLTIVRKGFLWVQAAGIHGIFVASHSVHLSVFVRLFNAVFKWQIDYYLRSFLKENLYFLFPGKNFCSLRCSFCSLQSSFCSFQSSFYSPKNN